MPLDPCPECGVHPDRLIPAPWGDGVQKVSVVPWLCGHCGALAILHLTSGRLTATTDAEWDPVRRHNPELWALVEETRALIRTSLEDTP